MHYALKINCFFIFAPVEFVHVRNALHQNFVHGQIRFGNFDKIHNFSRWSFSASAAICRSVLFSFLGYTFIDFHGHI